jgi:hypothetical protein
VHRAARIAAFASVFLCLAACSSEKVATSSFEIGAGAVAVITPDAEGVTWVHLVNRGEKPITVHQSRHSTLAPMAVLTLDPNSWCELRPTAFVELAVENPTGNPVRIEYQVQGSGGATVSVDIRDQA